MKYRSTTVSPHKSISEIEKLIVKYGARSFTKDLDGSRVTSVRFTLDAEAWGVPDLPVVLDVPVETILDRLWDSYSEAWQRQNDRDDYREQAERIAWRQIKDLIEQILLAAETGIASPVVMLFGMVEVTDPVTDERSTVAKLFQQQGLLTPAAGGRLLLGRGR
jgi:hypothetical protein